MSKVDILKEHIEKGYILARVTLEIIGRPKEHIVETLKIVIKQIKDSPNMKIYKGDLFKPKKDGEIWGTFAELEILFRDKTRLTNFCFDYMPASLEVIEPADLKFRLSDYNEIMASLLERIHQMDMVLKNINAENKIVKNNALAMLRNLLIISIGESKKSLKDISKRIGISEKQLEPFINNLIQKGFFEKEGDKIKIKEDFIHKEKITIEKRT